MRNLILIAALFASRVSVAAAFSEEIKVQGFTCEYGRLAIHLRSLDADRVLFLADDRAPNSYFYIAPDDCQVFAKNLTRRLTGHVETLRFKTESFSKRESVFIPRDPYCRTKCSGGESELREVRYERIRTEYDGLRFLREDEKRD